MEEKKTKSLGHIRNITMKTTAPLKMDALDLSFNDLTLLVGANGTGKSLAMITVFCLSNITSSAIIAKGADNKTLKEVAQYVFNTSFTDQNFDGVVAGKYQSGSSIEIVFSQGIVVDISVYIPDDVTEPTQIVYMSSGMRTFEAISSFLKMRKVVMNAMNIAGEPLILEMIKNYKLYDVLYIEKLLLSLPLHVPAGMRVELKKSFDFKDDLIEVAFDVDKSDLYYTCGNKPGVKTYLTTLSKGEQSILNMMIGSYMG